MITVATNPKRCGRTHRHTAHTWVTTPDARDEHRCDGRTGPRSVAQLVTERPALRGIRGAGVIITEGAMSA